MTVIEVTTPLVTTAVAVAGVVRLPPVSVTTGGNVYPEPPFVMVIAPTVSPLTVAVAVALMIGLRINDVLSLVAVTVNVCPVSPAPGPMPVRAIVC